MRLLALLAAFLPVLVMAGEPRHGGPVSALLRAGDHIVSGGFDGRLIVWQQEPLRAIAARSLEIGPIRQIYFRERKEQAAQLVARGAGEDVVVPLDIPGLAVGSVIAVDVSIQPSAVWGRAIALDHPGPERPCGPSPKRGNRPATPHQDGAFARQ